MAKKKKKKKSSDKLPYVHIDVLPEEEQLPDASLTPEMPDQAQGQPPAMRGQQRMNDPRRRGEGFEPYAAEVVSASGKGLTKKKSNGKVPVEGTEDSDVTPFVIPIFRKSDRPQQGPGMPPMQQRMYGTGQFPPVGGAPNGNPRHNLSQIQQNLLNHHNAARQQASQRSLGPQPGGQQIGPMAQPHAGHSMPQGSQPMGQMHGAASQAAKQNTGQFAPVSNQMAAQQRPQQSQKQAPVHGQGHPAQQNPNQQGGQPLRMQGTQAIPQGAMQAAANAAAARASQSRAAAAQAAMQTAAQAHQASQQGISTQAAHQMGVPGAQAAAAASRNAAFSQPKAMGANGHPAAQAAASTGSQPQGATGAPASQPKPAEDAAKDKASKPLVDSEAAEESTLFDKPPVSIEEGMRKSTSGRKKRRRVIIILAILIVLLGGGAAAYLILSEQGVVPRISIETATVPVTSQDSSNGGNANAANASNSSAASSATDPGTTPDTPAGGDLSGTVVYQYTANTASGVEYKVEETVTFQANGDCQSSTMNMTFPDAASAKTFTDNLARDYGTSFKLDSLNGNNAVVTIDNSGLHLTRDEYENALRYSVSDLVVNK